MTIAADLFQHFKTMWQAGTNARQSLESHAGEVWVNFQMHLKHPPPPPRIPPPPHIPPPSYFPTPPPVHVQQPPRKSASRLRRRIRRAQSRAAANAAVSNCVSADAAVQTDAAASNHTALSNDELHQQHRHQAADTGGQQQHLAGQAQQGFLRAQHIPDVFCPNNVYQQSASSALDPPLQNNLPQLDGNVTENDGDNDDEEWINPDPVTGLWICRCCNYAHTFKTEEDLPSTKFVHSCVRLKSHFIPQNLLKSLKIS